MEYVVIQFNRKSQSGFELAAILNEEFGLGEVTRFTVQQVPDSSNILIELLRDNSSKKRAGSKVFGIDPIELVASDMIQFVRGIGNQKFIAINLLPLGGQRALGIVVMAPELAAEKKLSDGPESKGKESKRKQNKNSDASADGGAEGGPVS